MYISAEVSTNFFLKSNEISAFDKFIYLFICLFVCLFVCFFFFELLAFNVILGSFTSFI